MRTKVELGLGDWKEPFQPRASFVPGSVLGPGVIAVSKTNGDEYYGEKQIYKE